MIEQGFCNGCNKSRFIVNKTYRLCDECNYKRLHKNKTKQQVAKEKQVSKPIKFKEKTGELEFFRQIWNKRAHKCTNCKRYLTTFNPAFFSHIKPKSLYPELRLDKDNIQILCFDCHFALDMQGQETYDKRTDMYLHG